MAKAEDHASGLATPAPFVANAKRFHFFGVEGIFRGPLLHLARGLEKKGKG